MTCVVDGRYTKDLYVLEVARIMGSVSFSAEFASKEFVFDIVSACMAAKVTRVGVWYWGMWCVHTFAMCAYGPSSCAHACTARLPTAGTSNSAVSESHHACLHTLCRRRDFPAGAPPTYRLTNYKSQIINQNGAAPGFEMYFAPSTLGAGGPNQNTSRTQW